ncbi:uncharacterized protein LOC132737848 [Ruditapes philippinarum]|uniref:uncharacterized protein LOC132737848 n=1 Tax=Ruditapes philippinarum TaxID=129788 RepID=UPI00295A8D15|nr:uncharacterized protein LOC132737848 [Ruditapes philippinarum]
MSKDGCPYGASKGWKTGYINISTLLPLDEPESYTEECQQRVMNFSFQNSTSVLGPFNKHTLQLNFCFESEEQLTESDSIRWFNGSYGIYGTDKGCPLGFSAHNMSICLPVLQYYNIDGHIPYHKVIETKDFTGFYSERCNQEFGMNNFDISENQITASSWQQSHEPREARPHLTDSAICESSYTTRKCMLPEMDLYSYNFLGRYDDQVNNHIYVWTLEGPTNSIMMTINFKEFDISCISESQFRIQGPYIKQRMEYCNSDRPHGNISLPAGTTNILYKPFKSNVFGSNPFPEGFQLKYNFIPMQDKITMAIDDADFPLTRKVCVDEFKKFYHLKSRTGSSWDIAQGNCENLKMTLINLKSKKEQQFTRELLLNFYYDVIKTKGTHGANPTMAFTYIGLTLEPDEMTGYGLLQFWNDGSPLTFTAWDGNEPSKIEKMQNVIMYLYPIENENPWKVIAGITYLRDLTVFACEEVLGRATEGISSKYKEVDKTRTKQDSHTLFECGSGEYVHALALCNAVSECLDASDERNCTSKPYSCLENEFECNDGRCIHVSRVCDFKNDCYNAEDEYCEFHVCKHISLQFTCTSGECIPIRHACDGEVHCLDGSDETDCENQIYVYCDFNNIHTDKMITMSFMNSDWKQISTTLYKITTPGIKEALNAGYKCKQKFSEVPRLEQMKVMDLENMTYHTYDWEFDLHSGSDETNGSFNTSFKLEMVSDGEIYDSFLLQTTESFTNNDYQNRLHIGNVICKKEVKNTDTGIFCRSGVNTVSANSRCLYNKDSRGRVTGCRSLNHLQNCGDFNCPKYYYKCPDSYCIPYMLVCNGYVDCGDGADESNCACSNAETRNILIIYEQEGDVFQTKYIDIQSLLGGSLYTANSTVRIVAEVNFVDFDEFGNYAGEFQQPLSISFDIKSNSYMRTKFENPSYMFDSVWKDNLKETNGIIWISDNIKTHLLPYFSEKPPFKLENVHQYFVTIDEGMKEMVTVKKSATLTNIRINQPGLLGTIGSALFPEICKPGNTDCEGMYRCSMSRVCIPMNQVCDGKKHCPYDDDEEKCEIKCPTGCTCSLAVINCSGVESKLSYEHLQSPLRILDVSNTVKLCQYVMDLPLLCRLYIFNLREINASVCHLKALNRKQLECHANVVSLDISHNLFETFLKDTFINLRKLKILYLHGNSQLRTLEAGAFNGLKVEFLNLKMASIEVLDKDTFSGLNLSRLDLSNNRIRYIEDESFNGMNCYSINIQNNPIKEFSKGLFTGVTGVEKIITPAFKFCCVRPLGLSEEQCLPHRDEFSSCEDLMRKTVLRVLLWVIGVMALSGNVMSLIYRLVYDRKRFKLGYGIFVTNLAVADLLMGIYMLIIAIADYWFRERYIEVDEEWRNGTTCKIAGILSTTSSETSVFFMCLITIDRILVIRYPFGQVRFTTKSAVATSLAGWVLALVIALFPILYSDFFEGSFYSKSGVCLALPLTRDRPPGWLYSVVIFIGLNFVTFVLIAAGQLFIFAEIKKTRTAQKSMNVSRKYDLTVARNLLLVVTTDFLCWFPIGVMGILSMNGYIIPGEVYAWTAVLILPINSALNPFMYTLSAVLGKSKFSPNIEEQTKSENAKETGKSMLLMHPFISGGLYNKKMSSLSVFEKDHAFTVKQYTCILHQVCSFVKLLHENELVLKTLTCDDVLFKVGNDGKIRAVKILRVPVMCEDINDCADDVIIVANLIRKSLFSFRRREN